MAYVKNIWVDQDVERPKTYEVTNNQDGSITLTDSFGLVTELGTPVNETNMNHIEDGIAGCAIRKHNLTETFNLGEWVLGGTGDDEGIYKPLVANNVGNAITDETKWQKVPMGGGGLEIGDIGIAPLGIDETKNKRRYLNGQVIIQDQYTSFTTKLKSAVQLYPSLACTEAQWQATATLSVGGQVGKFVIDNTAGTIRLPKIIMPIQGLTNLANLAEIVEAGLPNIEGTLDAFQGSLSGAFKSQSTRGGTYGGTSTAHYVTDFDASNSNSIYGNSTTVQQEQIQYPYFIQVATGVEESVDVVREIELNNPFSLFDNKYSEYELNNLSWLLSLGQWNSGSVYPSAYTKLLRIYNGTEEAGGISVKSVEQGNISRSISATSGWINPTHAFDGVLRSTYASCGTATDYIEVSYNRPVTISGFRAIGNFQSNVARACNVAIYSVDSNDIETLLANGTGASQTTTYITGATFTPVQVEKLRFKLIDSTEGTPPSTSYPTQISEITINLDDDSYNDYDFVINTTDETFRLPLKTKLASGKAVVGNGIALGLTNGSGNYGLAMDKTDNHFMTADSRAYGHAVSASYLGNSNGSSVNGVYGVTTDPTKSGIETSDSGLYLYYYVGETVQNANLINAGRIEEKVADCLTRGNKGEIISWGLPDYDNGIVLTYTTAHTPQAFIMPDDGVLAYSIGSGEFNKASYIKINNNRVVYIVTSSTSHPIQYTSGEITVSKDDVATVLADYSTSTWVGTSIIFYPMKGAN